MGEVISLVASILTAVWFCTRICLLISPADLPFFLLVSPSLTPWVLQEASILEPLLRTPPVAQLAQPLALSTCYFSLCLSLFSDPTLFPRTGATAWLPCSLFVFTFAFPLLFFQMVLFWQQRTNFLAEIGKHTSQETRPLLLTLPGAS